MAVKPYGEPVWFPDELVLHPSLSTGLMNLFQASCGCFHVFRALERFRNQGVSEGRSDGFRNTVFRLQMLWKKAKAEDLNDSKKEQNKNSAIITDY